MSSRENNLKVSYLWQSIGVDECIPVKGDYNSAQLPAGRFQRWSPVVLKWSMIICFPFWFAALLKLVMVEILIFITLLYIGLFSFVVPPVAPYFYWNQKLEPPDSKCWLSLEWYTQSSRFGPTFKVDGLCTNLFSYTSSRFSIPICKSYLKLHH